MISSEKATLDFIDEWNLRYIPGQAVKVKMSYGIVRDVLASAAWYDNKTKSPIIALSKLGRVDLRQIIAPEIIRATDRESLIRSLLCGYRDNEKTYLATVKTILTAEEYLHFEKMIRIENHG